MSDLEAELAIIDAQLQELSRKRALVARSVARASAEAVPFYIDSWQAAEQFGVPIDTVRWWARNKKLGHKAGGRWMIDVNAVNRYLRKRE
ncbi:helix-turn-helix domain-containing protein [Aureimonas altamirensis]|uniref:helix-turn-helix domain-containing protein n=1 Tax=Aureimonas altamirensis TaxID=370622 RepID=UPI0025566873|nr:helix-turn-helix domain-containing protein [Aureimonas altamirensis]